MKQKSFTSCEKQKVGELNLQPVPLCLAEDVWNLVSQSPSTSRSKDTWILTDAQLLRIESNFAKVSNPCMWVSLVGLHKTIETIHQCRQCLWWVSICLVSMYQWYALPGAWWERNWHVLIEQALAHTWGTNLHTSRLHVPLQKPHISLQLLYTVCDREIRGFTTNFPKTFNVWKRIMIIQFEWIGAILTKYQPLGGRLQWQIPLLNSSNIRSRYARWGIPLIGALCYTIQNLNI